MDIQIENITFLSTFICIARSSLDYFVRWKDGINTMIENVQGHDFLVLNHNRTQLGFGPVDSSQAAAANGGN